LQHPCANARPDSDLATVTGTPNPPDGDVRVLHLHPTEVAANGGTCAAEQARKWTLAPDEPDGEVLVDVSDPPNPNDGLSGTESDPVTPNEIGTWCFREEYSGDESSPADADASEGECLEVGHFVDPDRPGLGPERHGDRHVGWRLALDGNVDDHAVRQRDM
jgi:hypothetical protein